MNVKTRIATFEAHNQEVRRTVSPSRRALVSPNSSVSNSPVSEAFEKPSPDRPPSTTSLASQNRINRLLKQKQDHGLHAPQPPDSPGGGSIRQMRQNQLARLTNQSPSGSLSSSDTNKAKLPAHLVPPRAIQRPSIEGSPGIAPVPQKRSRQPFIPQPADVMQPDLALNMDGRHNHDDSLQIRLRPRQQQHQQNQARSIQNSKLAETSTSQASPMSRANRISRIQLGQKLKSMEHYKRHNQQLQQQRRTTPSPTDPIGLDHPQKDDLSANDDEITLTSVRQIVGSSPENSPHTLKGVDENISNNHLLLHHEQQQQPRTNSSPRLWMREHPDDDDEDEDDDDEEKSEKINPLGLLPKMRYRHSSSGNNNNINGSNNNNKHNNNNTSRRSIRMSRSSSTEYDTDNDSRPALMEPAPSAMSASQMTPNVAAFFDERRRSRRLVGQERDDDTFDYAEEEDDEMGARAPGENDSQVSLSYEQKRIKEEKEKEARKAAAAAARAEMEGIGITGAGGGGGGGAFVPPEEFEQYQKHFDTPMAKTAAGVVGAAAVGCLLLGPVGLIVGAAAAGIGVGYMQIPEEERDNMQKKASEAVKNVQDSACKVSETISNSCMYHYKDSGVSDHLPLDVETCCAGMEEVSSPAVNEGLDESLVDGSAITEKNTHDHNGAALDAKRVATPIRSQKVKDNKQKAACLRDGDVIPLTQIYALAPAAQPRAWLDVLASANSSPQDRLEALEEVTILAKDKQRARIFLEEGILDSLMWTIGRYFEKVDYRGTEMSQRWAHPDVTMHEANEAKLSAICCLTLGKSHCAAIHTEGDLLLMSLYERGTVPEERQLAQMLHEVPYHIRSTETDDPTVVHPAAEVFSIQQLTLPQAEELARSIKAVAEGRYDNNNNNHISKVQVG